MLFNIEINDPTSGFRIIDKKLYRNFFNEDIRFAMEPINICQTMKMKYTVKEISVEMNIRKYGKSSINNFNGIFYMLYFFYKSLNIYLKHDY